MQTLSIYGCSFAPLAVSRIAVAATRSLGFSAVLLVVLAVFAVVARAGIVLAR